MFGSNGSNRNTKKSAADCRTTAVQLLLMLSTSSDIDWKVYHLIECIVRVSEVMCADESVRSPKMLLQLYNNAWLHHQLFSQSKILKCLYLHSISKHAPEQYEIVCLKSINTENQERMFGHSRHIAEKTSNRHASNIITSVMIRMQCITGRTKATSVSSAAAHVSSFGGTIIPVEFAAKHKHSWQAHLYRISPFLVCGESV